MRRLEAELHRAGTLQQHKASDLLSIAAGYARNDERVFVQNTVSAGIHMAKGRDDGHTVCGWKFSSARKKGTGLPYRMVNSLCSIPWQLLCERCLPTERELAKGAAIEEDDALSGDE